MMVGDNIYHRPEAEAIWQQLDSHHSLADGSPNPLNVENDTKADRVLVSRHFYYFGSKAPLAPAGMLKAVGFKNAIGHRVFEYGVVRPTAEVDYLSSRSRQRGLSGSIRLQKKREEIHGKRQLSRVTRNRVPYRMSALIRND